MSDVDEELAQAVAESEAEVEERGVEAPPPEPPNGPKKGRGSIGLLVALLVMGAAILSLVMTSFEDAAIYSKGVDELLVEKQDLEGRNLRVQGILVKGTLVRRDQPCEYRFRMKKGDSEVEVRYPQCVVPDTFRDVPEMDVEVTAMGTIAAAGHFEATEIMAKCPSKYDMKERAAKGEKAPHGEIVPAAVPGTPQGY